MDLTKLAELADIAAGWDTDAAHLAAIEQVIRHDAPEASLAARGRKNQAAECAQELRDWIREQVKT